MRFIFEQLRVGGDRNFGYLIGDRQTGTGVLVDPSYTPEAAVQRASDQGLRITHILNTHGHSDHTNGNAIARSLTGAKIAGGPGHPDSLDLTLHDGDRIPCGSYGIRVWHVPGHCPDHLAFLIEGLNAGITGDLLFVGKVGGTASDADGRTEWESLRRLLQEWPQHTTIWPGHDYGARPSSTLDWEQQFNPFLQCAEVNAFLELKMEWVSFKVKHGLK